MDESLRNDDLRSDNGNNKFEKATESVFDASFLTVFDQDDSEHTPGEVANILDACLTPSSSFGDLSSAENSPGGHSSSSITKKKKKKKKNSFPDNSPRKRSTSSNKKANSSVYQKVKYHDEVGKLVLTADKIIFKPYDGGAPTRGSMVALTHDSDDEDQAQSSSHSWRWKMIEKHQISPTTSPKTLLKLVSVGSGKKAVTFAICNRDELERIRKDISRRLRYAQKEDATVAANENGNTAETNGGHAATPSVDIPAPTKEEVALETPNESTALLQDIGSSSTEAATSTSIPTTVGNATPFEPIPEQKTTTTVGRSNFVWVGVVALVLLLIGIKVFQTMAPSVSDVVAAEEEEPVNSNDRFLRALRNTMEQQQQNEMDGLGQDARVLRYLRGSHHRRR